VWNGDRKMEGADPETFERIGTSVFGYYRDAKRVYSYFGRLKVVEGADPRTFRKICHRILTRRTESCQLESAANGLAISLIVDIIIKGIHLVWLATLLVPGAAGTVVGVATGRGAATTRSVHRR
jgi:hypothetical protein